MNFQDPWALLIVPIVPLVLWYVKRRRSAAVRYSSARFLEDLGTSFKVVVRRHLVFLRGGVLLLMLLAMARPQSFVAESRIETEGIDIVLAVDASTSMLAADFKLGGRRRNRLEVVKDVVEDFIQGRQHDRIGMVAFAGRAYTVCPLTLDYDWLSQNVDRVTIGMIEDGTAVGSGISSSLNRLKSTEAKGKVIILLTDGRSNAGTISPLVAAEAATALGIKIYTIGAGTKGLAPYPMRDVFGNIVYRPIKIDLDEDTLRKIAAETDGKYYRATDTESLREIYREIDRLEKTPIEERGYIEYEELFHLFLIPALALLLLEVVLANGMVRKIP
jgi:Ca-activated chloride channel family protein